MQVVAAWVSFYVLVANNIVGTKCQQQYNVPLSFPTGVSGGAGLNEKRANMAEPSCDELRAMWRYSKRQSRAAEITNEIPTYRDPFAYNVWEPYLDRAQSSVVYRETAPAPARSRGAGGAHIYGRVVHKAPAGHSLRSGMPDRSRAFEEVTLHYGTVNRHPATTPPRQTNFRVAGGASRPSSTNPGVPQAGSFQHLKELIRTERARELREQRIAEEVAARAAALKEMTNGRRPQSERENRQHYRNSLQPYNDMKNINYDYDQVQYVSNAANLGQSLSRGDQYGRGYSLR